MAARTKLLDSLNQNTRVKIEQMLKQHPMGDESYNKVKDWIELLESNNADTPIPPPSIENVIENDLNKKTPEAIDARKDIDDADHTLQREEEHNTYFGPTAPVKSNEEEDEATKQLKAEMAKIEERKKEKENSLADTAVATASSLIDALSSGDKGKLEQSLENDMDKLSSNILGMVQSKAPKSPVVVDTMAVTVGKSDDKTEDPSIKSLRDSGLNVADLRELLEITRMAEKQTASKRVGLMRPNLAHLHAAKLLQKGSVRRFLRYLIKRRELSKALNRLKAKTMQHKQQVKKYSPMTYEEYHKIKEEKYENNIRKLVSQWNKSHKDVSKKTNSALPKFHG